MSVFTPVRSSELSLFLEDYDLGSVVEFQGIEAGVENTNYFLTTTRGRFVLTLFEQHESQAMPWFLNLMGWLNEHGIPSAHPVADRFGTVLKELNHRPSAIVQRLPGVSREHPSHSECQMVAEVMGRMHLAGNEFPEIRPNDRGLSWMREIGGKIAPLLEKEDLELLETELRYQSLYRFTDLPQGVIHADLFRDNVLWQGDSLSGVIDFYYACNGLWLYDLAVMVNDWCSHDNGQLDFERMMLMLESYHMVRPLLSIERGAWPVLLRMAALRFWLSRLRDLYFPRPAQLSNVKNPKIFKEILRNRIDVHETLLGLWVG